MLLFRHHQGPSGCCKLSLCKPCSLYPSLTSQLDRALPRAKKLWTLAGWEQLFSLVLMLLCTFGQGQRAVHAAITHLCQARIPWHYRACSLQLQELRGIVASLMTTKKNCYKHCQQDRS